MENHVDGTMNMLGGGSSAGRKPLKSGMKELAVFREKVNEQHRQMGKGGKHLGLEEPKKLRPPPARVRGGVGSDGGEEGVERVPHTWKEYHTQSVPRALLPTTDKQRKPNHILDIFDDL